ncbi:Ancient ubiquitous protein 1 [Eumeta japonica]|uniref:Ancient ubiquitous protein 1 n=1 Tax=Eumeta variegata TaxID=151549 RepID=A0A4C1V986_EUMVA|nr:Ancient ubiquitous protein 1 [Eumeta japonica]
MRLGHIHQACEALVLLSVVSRDVVDRPGEWERDGSCPNVPSVFTGDRIVSVGVLLVSLLTTRGHRFDFQCGPLWRLDPTVVLLRSCRSIILASIRRFDGPLKRARAGGTGSVLDIYAQTRSVDITITNFLEGVTPYTPEPEHEPTSTPTAQPEPQPSTSRGAPAPASVASAPVITSPFVFPKSAKERQMTFQERKAQMIATARQRYIEKHRLNVA